MNDQTLENIAGTLSKNRREGVVSDLPFDVLQTEDEALLVQSEALSKFDDDALGYAIVGGSFAVRRGLGIETPIYGPIPVGAFHRASNRPYRLPAGIIGAQCDLVFTMGAPLGADCAPITRDMFCASVLTCQPSVGLVGRRGHLSGRPRLAAIADFALHIATLVGDRHEMPHPRAFAGMAVRASIDDRTVLDAQADGRLVDPIASAVWLANDLVRRNRHLRAGDIVSTGALAPILLQVLPGQELQVGISDVGRIAVRLA